MSPYKPTMLHDSKIYQEFQRLGAWLNGTAPGLGSGGVLSVLGTYFVESISGGANTNLNGDTNASCSWDDTTEVVTGEAFGTIGVDEIFEFTADGVYYAVAYAGVELDDSTAVTAMSAGAGMVFDATGVESVYTVFGPTLYDGQYTDFSIASPIFASESGDRIQWNPNLNSGDPTKKWSIDSAWLSIVKLA